VGAATYTGSARKRKEKKGKEGKGKEKKRKGKEREGKERKRKGRKGKKRKEREGKKEKKGKEKERKRKKRKGRKGKERKGNERKGKERKGNSSRSCCNCKLKEGESLHLANYRSCSHAKEEKIHKKNKKFRKNIAAGRLFSSKYSPQEMSAAPETSVGPTTGTGRGRRDECHSPCHTARVSLNVSKVNQSVRQSDSQPASQAASYSVSQSVQDTGVNSSYLDDMCRVTPVMQQIVTQVSGPVSGGVTIVVSTKIVYNLMEITDHWSP
jgi:hypothetical protein